ncbi:hypothetical protein [Lentzea sp.]|uniref:hypothetical protein n=1 Tax=Lentzea sp. TaxID=56099 RepID=UPI002ED22F78
MTPELERFHRLLRSAVAEHRPAGHFMKLLDQNGPAPWPDYAVAMFEMTIDPIVKRSLRQA